MIEEEDDDVVKEFIFLIDRSGSMYQTIVLARRALVLFLYSLPPNSRFNIISYGSKHEYMFEERSVEYNDDTMNYAISIVEKMEANFGGTNIHDPLQDLYSRSTDNSVGMTHIMLLTDGAIWDTNRVVDLVKNNTSNFQRVHTFGVGSGADEALIKRCAFAGFGNYYFVYDENQIEEKVVTAIQRTKVSFKTVNQLRLYDQDGQEIENQYLLSKSEPIIDGCHMQCSVILEPK